jgi:hypothetical protein
MTKNIFYKIIFFTVSFMKKPLKSQQCPPKPKPSTRSEVTCSLRLDGCLVSPLVIGTRTFASEAHERLIKPVAFYLPRGKERSCVVFLLLLSLSFFIFSSENMCLY